MVTFWLDWKLFGNGHGMASPAADDAFYWLSGRFYRPFGGLGAQLTSYEWSRPPAGTRRRIMDREIVIFQTHRKWFRVECSWALSPSVKDFEEVAAFHEKLKNWGHG